MRYFQKVKESSRQPRGNGAYYKCRRGRRRPTTDRENQMYWKIEDRIAETAAYIAKQETASRISRTAVETLSRDVDAIWDACEAIIEESERVGARYHLSVAERLHGEATELAKRLGALHQKRVAA